MKPYYEDGSCVIYHGDCREVMPTLGLVDMVLTDPPYNADLHYGTATDDSRTWIDYGLWLGERIRMMESVTVGPVMVFVSVAGMIELTRIHPPRWVGGWIRPGPGNPVGSSKGTLLLPSWEPCLFYGGYGWEGTSLVDAWQTRSLSERNGHPCPKPSALMSQILQRLPSARTVLDPFMGSGTTLRGAKNLGRRAIGIEIEERYCEIAASRLGQEVFDIEVAA